MPLSYADVLDRYDRAKAFGESRSLPEYSQAMNELYGTQDFSEGMRDGPWTRFSTRLDQNVFQPIASVTTAPIGEAVGGIFGHPEAGQRVGMGIPRALAETLPLYLAGPEAGLPATAAAALGTGGLMAAHTYADTGSPTQAAISGVTGTVLPSVGRFAGNVAARAFGAQPVTGEVADALGNMRPFSQVLPTEEGYAQQQMARFVGSQTGQVLTNQASMYASDRAAGKPYDPTDPEFWLNQIPFTVFDAVHMATAPRTTVESMKGRVQPAVATEPEAKPYTPPEGSPESQARVEQLFKDLSDTANDPTIAPQDKATKLATLALAVNDPKRLEQLAQAGNATKDNPLEAPVTITGRAEKSGDNYRVLVDDIQTAAKLNVTPGSTVFVNGVEPQVDPVTGRMRFDVKAGDIRPAKYGLAPEDFDKLGTHPELPVQEVPGELNWDVPLTTADKQALVGMGMEPEEYGTPDLKRATNNFEIGQQIETNERTKLEQPLDSQEAIAQAFPQPEAVKEQLKAQVDDGKSAVQAVKQTRLSLAIKAIDEALKDQNEAKELAKVVYESKTRIGQDVYGEALKDEEGGRRTFGSSAEAQEFLHEYETQHPEDDREYNVRDNGRGGFYLAPKLNVAVSFEAPRGQEGGTLENVLSQDQFREQAAEELGYVQAEDRPEVSFERTIGNIERGIKEPRIFAASMGLDPSDPLDIIKATRIAKQARVMYGIMNGGEEPTMTNVNPELKKLGITPLKTMDELRSVLKSASMAADDYNRRVMKFDPRDPAKPQQWSDVAREIGLDQPTALRNWLTWFSKHPDSGIMGELTNDMVKALPALDKVKFVLPGHPDYYEGGGSFYVDPTGTQPMIQISRIPHSPEEAFQLGLTVAHETAHYAGREILGGNEWTGPVRNDVAAQQLRNTLEQAREAILNSKQLPKDVRDLARAAIADGHYEEFSKGNWDAIDYWQQKLGSKKFNDYYNIVYGLLNHDELLAQIFSRPEMIALASTVKMPKTLTQSVLDFFSSSWNRLFGGQPKNDSALSQILKGFDQYLTGGIIPKSYDGMDYIRDQLVAGGVHPDELMNRLYGVERTFSTGSLRDAINNFAGVVNPNMRLSLLGGDATNVLKTTKNLLAHEVSDHEDLHDQLKQDLRMATTLASKIKEGAVPGVLPPDAELKLASLGAKLNAFQRGLATQRNAISRFNDLGNFTQAGMETTLSRGLSDTRFPAPPDPTGLEKEAQQQLGLRTEAQREVLEGKSPLTGAGGWLKRTFMLTQFLKQQIPGFRPVADHVAEEQARMNYTNQELNYAYASDPKTQEPTKERLQANRRVVQDPKLNQASSDIKRWVQVQERDPATRNWKWDAPFLKNVLGKLTPQEQSAVKLEFENATNRHNTYIEHIVPTFLSDLQKEQTAHAIVALEPGMSADAARQSSTSLYTALAMLQDPPQMAQGQSLLQAVASKMQPDTFMRALSLSQGLVQDGNDHLTFLRSRPNYVTEQRMDKHQIVMVTPDQKPYRASFGSKSEALAKVQELEKKGYQFLDYVPKSDANVRGGIAPEMMQSLQTLDQQAGDRLRQTLQGKVDEDTMQQVLASTQRGAEYQQSLTAAAPVPGAGTPGRRFIAGREELDMTSQANAFYRRAANWMRHKMVRAKTDVDLLDPTLTQNPEAKSLASQHVENQLSLDNPLARKLVEGTYFWKLAWNFGVNMLHGIQTMTTGMASAIAETGSVGDAFDYTGKAMKEMLQRYRPGGNKEWSTPQIDWFMKRFVSEGHAGWGGYDEFTDQDRANVYDTNTPAGAVGKGLDIVKSAAKGWTGMFLKYNDSIGGLAGFMLGKDRGMSNEDAYRFAVDLKDRGYYTGGKAQRGVGLWSIQSKAVPQLMSSLNTYTFGWFSQLANNWSNGFGRAPEGLTPTQRLGAKKAFLYQLGAQAVLAGALGMPGMGQGLALLKQVTGVDTKDWVKQNLGKMFQDDVDHGALMSTLAMHGLVAGLTPIDPSGRHMISFPFTGVNPYKGFDPQNFLPAPVTSAADLVKSIMSAAKGNPQGITQGLPHILQGPYKLMQGEGDIRDARGSLLYQLSPAERFIQALGFDSSRVQEAKETAEMLKEANAKALKEQELVQDSMARRLRQGDVEGVQQSLQQYKQDHPEVDLRAMARGIAQRVVAQTVPQDARQHINPAADLVGVPQTEPQNAARRQAAFQAQAQLGLAPRPNPALDIEAERMDAIQRSNPYMSPAEARQAVRGFGPTGRQYTGLWSPALQ